MRRGTVGNAPGVVEARGAGRGCGLQHRVLGVVALEVEVATEDGAGRVGLALKGLAALIVERRLRRVRAGLAVQVDEGLGLRRALARGIELQVRRHHPDRAQRRKQGGAAAHARHRAHAAVGRVGQGVVAHLRHGQARGHQVAEALALAVAAEFFNRGTETDLKARQQLAQPRHLVEAGVAVEARIVDGHFLQAQHVEVGHRQRFVHHALDADRAVQAAEPLHVPGDEFHLIPARMKLCTNWR